MRGVEYSISSLIFLLADYSLLEMVYNIPDLCNWEDVRYLFSGGI